MKCILIIALLLPFMVHAQRESFDGVYTLPEPKNVRLKPWDTIRQAFTFAADSFKYSYAVMRPSGVRSVAVSVDYSEYGTWKFLRDTTLSEPDKHTSAPVTFRRSYVSLDSGRIYGYFEPAFAADSIANGPTNAVFISNNKIFTKTKMPDRPLKRGE